VECENQRALAELWPRLATLTLPANHATLLRVNVPQAVANCAEVASSLQRDEERFQASFRPGGFWVVDHHDLLERGRALWQADINLRCADTRAAELRDLVPEAKALRRALRSAATYVWEDDESLSAKVRAIRGGSGYVDTANALVVLAGLLGDHWSEIADRTRVQAGDLPRARELAERLLLVRPRRSRSVEQRRLRDVQQRAMYFALLGVEDVRRAAAVVFRQPLETLEGYPCFFKKQRKPRRRRVAGHRVEAAQPLDPGARGDTESRAG
jgi:hypothetical protein